MASKKSLLGNTAQTKIMITTLLILMISLMVLPIVPVMATPITITILPMSGAVGSAVTVSGIGGYC